MQYIPRPALELLDTLAEAVFPQEAEKRGHLTAAIEAILQAMPDPARKPRPTA